MLGRLTVQLALYLSHSYSNDLDMITEVSPVTESGTPKTPVEILIERLQQIQKELPSHGPRESEEELAFLQAAEEQYQAADVFSHGRFLNQR